MEIVKKGKQLFNFKPDNSIARLEQIISSDNFDVSLQTLKPELLYTKNSDMFYKPNFASYMFKSNHDVSILDNDELVIDLLTQESKQKLQQQNFTQIHLGLVVVAVYNKIKTETSARAHIAIIDQRHDSYQKGILATSELDMSEEKRMVACSPNYTVTIDEFINKIRIIVQTKSYEINKNQKNLWIETYFIGKLSNILIKDSKFQKKV